MNNVYFRGWIVKVDDHFSRAEHKRHYPQANITNEALFKITEKREL
jgi:hypothetical protein